MKFTAKRRSRLASMVLRRWLALAGLASLFGSASTRATEKLPLTQPMAVPGVGFTEIPAPLPGDAERVDPPAGDAPVSDGGTSVSWWARCRRRLWRADPQHFVDPPLGEAVYGALRPQMVRGQAALMTLYDYDFSPSEKLTPRGVQQLQKIARLAEQNPFPVLVQGTGNDRLDAMRRDDVLEQSARFGAPLPPERIVVGMPQTIGLQGDEAKVVYDTLMRQTQAGGKPSGAVSTPSNSTSSSTTNASPNTGVSTGS